MQQIAAHNVAVSVIPAVSFCRTTLKVSALSTHGPKRAYVLQLSRNPAPPRRCNKTIKLMFESPRRTADATTLVKRWNVRPVRIRYRIAT